VTAPTEFAGRRVLSREQLKAAPIRWPQPSRLLAPLPLAGDRARRAAASLSLHSVGALLEHLPRDRRDARPISALTIGEAATLLVEVRSIAARPVRRRGMRPLVEATVSDSSGSLVATFFNQPWLVGRYPPGTRLLLHGRLSARGRLAVQAHAPAAGGPAAGEPAADSRPAGGAATDGARAAGRPGHGQAGDGSPPRRPAGDDRAAHRPTCDGQPGGQPAQDAQVGHYAATEGLSSTRILALVREHEWAFAHVAEPLPAALRAAERLPDRPAALWAAHHGDERTRAVSIRRLALEELLARQLAMLRRRRQRREGARALALGGEPALTARWLERHVPFELTSDQRRAIEEIQRDLADPRPMQRLLMGEVGSGKTVVALYALLRAVEHGCQGALMAPTEPLAEQHFHTLQSLLGDELVPIALLTGSTAGGQRAQILARLASGELSLVVGTHALIEPPVRFAALAVAVVDEQHRFGVRQRAALDAKAPDGRAPHVLHMSATPIPRTLALSQFGDLDQTVLRELPRGRLPVATHVCSSARERARAYERIREELRAGRQAFVVCPLISESEQSQARAASAEYERLRDGELRGFPIVLMHGRLTPAAKQLAMDRFASGAAGVMVATSVIEVGIDVPNATVMLIEDADRYGLSQLHQLRGRVGRGRHRSLCLLFGPRASARLRAMERHSDGFTLAEIDLELRGEGDLAGTRQSGTAQLRFAQLPRDRELQERARRLAEGIDARDPWLRLPEHALLSDLAGEALGGM